MVLKDEWGFLGRQQQQKGGRKIRAKSTGEGQGGTGLGWGIFPRLGRNGSSREIMFSDPVIIFTLGRRIMSK